MRPIRSSLRTRARTIRTRAWRTAFAIATLVLLGVIAGCGGGAASPTATVAPATTTTQLPVPSSPQRPALASPVVSPSAIVASATPTAAATDVVGGETHEVQSGDTLLSIADQYYGDVTQWRRIYDANKDTIGPDPDKLKIGMKLTIPPKQS